MKKLESNDDLNSAGEKSFYKDSDSNRRLSHHDHHYKTDNGRKGLRSSYSARHGRSLDEDRNTSRSDRKRSSYCSENFARRKGFDRYRDCVERGGSLSQGGDRIYRSESFGTPRREFPKWYRSERDRARREGSVSSWARFGGNKDYDDGGKSSSDSVRGSRSGFEDRGRSLRDAKSPAWSKESCSDQSKSAEVKKSEEVMVESGGCSEMEEGELEPELEWIIIKRKTENEVRTNNDLDRDQEGMETHDAVEKMNIGDVTRSSVAKEEKEPKGNIISLVEVVVSGVEFIKEEEDCEGKPVAEHLETVKDAVMEVDKSADCEEMITDRIEGSRDDDEEDKSLRQMDVREDTTIERTFPSVKENEEVNAVDTEIQAETSTAMKETDLESSRENECPGSNASTEDLMIYLKDKDKSMATSSSHVDIIAGRGEECMEGVLNNSVYPRDGDLIRTGSRGFELFSCPLAKKKPEKTDRLIVQNPKDENLTLELDLSLSPNVLLPISMCDLNTANGSHSDAKTMKSQSAATPAGPSAISVSFSGSEKISHNPSCSLLQNSVDNYELSVGSKPIFHGLDGQSSSLPRQKEVPLYQKMLMNENGVAHQPLESNGMINGHLSLGSSHVGSGLDQQSSINRQLVGAPMSYYIDVGHLTQCAGSLETGSRHSKERKQMMKQKLSGSDLVETMISMMVSEPIHFIARWFQEMSEQSLTRLRDGISGMLVNVAGKRGQRSAFLQVPPKWSDITMEMLLRCPRAQLEIMVALKTGLSDVLQQHDTLPASVLAEIFLDLRCRNVNCKQPLPVDGCDCKICSHKNGFCNVCMCIICSKFDMAFNTCSWVGCDVCLHWCHTDCGLRESLIRNGESAKSTQGISEMQFHCAACGHPSEMFGFIKEVFQNFAKTWPTQTLMKELKYARTIFCASKDVRGKHLHDIAELMLSRLTNGSDLPDVYNPILNFLLGSGTVNYNNAAALSGKEQGEASKKATNWGQEDNKHGSVYSGKASQLEKTPSILPQLECSKNDESILKEPVFDELDSIIRMKQAEAKMFQARADDARNEAHSLKQIAIAKNNRIEEEFGNQIMKLCLGEAEQMRQQKLEQLQALERAHREYYNMKMRMEADIKDLLLKMEATKQNLSM